MSERRKILDLLDGELSNLGEGELKVALRLCRRLRVGQERYGKLSFPTGRDWRRERNEELDDALIYALFEAEEREGTDVTV